MIGGPGSQLSAKSNRSCAVTGCVRKRCHHSATKFSQPSLSATEDFVVSLRYAQEAVDAGNLGGRRP